MVENTMVHSQPYDHLQVTHRSQHPVLRVRQVKKFKLTVGPQGDCAWKTFFLFLKEITDKNEYQTIIEIISEYKWIINEIINWMLGEKPWKTVLEMRCAEGRSWTHINYSSWGGPAQDQAHKHPTSNGGGTHEAPPWPGELRATRIKSLPWVMQILMS